jgi:hypothetical protein
MQPGLTVLVSLMHRINAQESGPSSGWDWRRSPMFTLLASVPASAGRTTPHAINRKTNRLAALHQLLHLVQTHLLGIFHLDRHSPEACPMFNLLFSSSCIGIKPLPQAHLVLDNSGFDIPSVMSQNLVDSDGPAGPSHLRWRVKASVKAVVILVLSLCVWVYFYLVGLPLGAPGTAVVVGVMALLVTLADALVRRIRKRPQERQNAGNS